MQPLKGAIGLLAFFLSFSHPAIAPEDKQPLLEVIVEEKVYDAFTRFMIACESGGDPNAINPKDLDNTPSYGIVQFKPSTLYYYAHEKYKLLPDIEREEIMNVIFDADVQIQTFEKMRSDPDVNWYQEFPTCYRLWMQRTS